MPVRGESGYSSQGKTAVRMSFEPINAGDYELALVGQSVETRVPDTSGVPYINCSFVARGTALQEGQKDRRVFKKFWLGIEPSPNTGAAPVDSADQLLGYARALGEELNFAGDDTTTVTAKNDKGETRQVRILRPKAVKAWLQEHDNTVVQARVKVRRGRKDKRTGQMYDDQNEIDYFIEADQMNANMASVDDDEYEVEADGPHEDVDVDVESEPAPEPPRKNGKVKNGNSIPKRK